MKKVLSIGLACLALGGCVTMPGAQEVPRPEFPVEEYQELEGRTGTGTVVGQVFLRTRAGEVRYGAGSQVMLNPVTSYSTHWYVNAYVNNRRIAAPDHRLERYILTTQADGSGNFRFENVPPGEYYLTSRVIWEVPGPYFSSQQGGWISEPITVEDGKEIRKMLTR